MMSVLAVIFIKPAVNAECATTTVIYEDSTNPVVESPGYGNGLYANNLDCSWSITAPAGKVSTSSILQYNLSSADIMSFLLDKDSWK